MRLMTYPGYPDGLRMTIGTDAEIDALLEVLEELNSCRWEVSLQSSRTGSGSRGQAETLKLCSTRRVAEIVRKTHRPDGPIGASIWTVTDKKASPATGIGFLDHMLELFARHSLMDLTIRAPAICTSTATTPPRTWGFAWAKRSIAAWATGRASDDMATPSLPMDETLVTTAIDLGGRALLGLERADARAQDRNLRQRAGRGFLAGGFVTGADEPAREPSLRTKHSSHCRSDLQVGGPFPARRAERNPRCNGVPSTKGTL